MNEYAQLSSNLSEVRERIAAAAARSGREAGSVTLLAVSKFNPLAAIEAAWELGIRHFGESRIQEAEEKFPAFLAAHPEVRLEMIGHLQSNKARKAVELCSRVQSVDSIELLRELDKRARGSGKKLEILFELHTGEESKNGFRDPEELFRACESLLEISRDGKALYLRGLMTMAPFLPDPDPIRASFRALRKAFDEALLRFGFPDFDVLSMGMTNDFEIAIEEGATLVRIGTAIFGKRAP